MYKTAPCKEGSQSGRGSPQSHACDSSKGPRRERGENGGPLFGTLLLLPRCSFEGRPAHKGGEGTLLTIIACIEMNLRSSGPESTLNQPFQGPA